MPTLLMTDRFVAGARGATRKNYFDTKVKGLTLRVTEKGSKSWSFVYRRDGQPPQWLGLGTYPAVKLAEARKQALDQRHAVDVEGRDPVAEQRAARVLAAQPPPPPDPPAPTPAVFTFADFVPAFIAFQKGRKKTWKDDADKIDKYLRPVWGPLPLAGITRRHVHELLNTVQAKGLTVGVNRIQALISRIFTVALDQSLIDAHPAARIIKRFVETPGERELSDDELRALWAGLDAQPGDASDAARLRLLLGQRGAETAGMRWAELDLTAGIWALPGRRTKNGRPHAVGLPPTALALLQRRRATVPDDEPRVFPGLTLTGDDHRALGVIHGGAYTWKDLRRTVATRLAGLGFDDTVNDRVLNHARSTVTSKHYNRHDYADEIRRALTAWDTELERVLTNAPKKSGVVLPMRGR